MSTNKSNKLHENPSILIILMGSLGDLIRGLCIVSHIKNNRPKSKITWLVEPKWIDLVNYHPGIDKVIVFNRPKHIIGVWELFVALNKEHFDITLDLQRHIKSGVFSFLSRAKKRIGFHRRDSKELNWIFNNEHIEYFSERHPKILHYLEFTKHLGLSNPTEIDFGFSHLNHTELAPAMLSGLKKPFIAMVLGSSWKSKDWVTEGYVNLINQITSSWNMGVVLLGDRSQKYISGKICNQLNVKNLLDLVGTTSLMELMAVLKEARAAVGPDSGPGHMSAAVGTPYVTLFGPTSPDRTAPYRCERFVVQSTVHCAGCYQKRCHDLDRECMRRITADMVSEKINLILNQDNRFTKYMN